VDIFGLPRVYMPIGDTEVHAIAEVVAGGKDWHNVAGIGDVHEVYYVIYPHAIVVNAYFSNGVVGIGRILGRVSLDPMVTSQLGKMLHWVARETGG
jgi:hypothetical protein